MRDEGMWDWGREAQSSQPSPEASCGVAGGAAPTLQSFVKCPTPFQLGDSAGPVLVPALAAHPHITGQAAGTWDPQPLTPWAPCSSTTTPQHELGASPARGGFAPGSCQDLLSIWKSFSLKLSPVNTRLVLTWLCCPGKFQLLFILCFYPFG